MGHKYIFGSQHILDGEDDQGWNHIQAPVRLAGREDGFHLGNKVPIDRVNHASAWVPLSTSGGHPSSSHASLSRNPSGIPGPRDSLQQLPPSGTHVVPPNRAHHASSSNHAVERNFVDLSTSSSGGLRKRKRPQVPPFDEMASTHRYYSRGSSSAASSSADPQQERLNIHAKHTRWEPMSPTPTFGSHHYSGEAESSGRNVSRRSSESGSEFFGMNRPGMHPNQRNLHSHHHDHDHSADYSGQDRAAPLPEWSFDVLPAIPRARTTALDSSIPNHEMAQFFNGNSASNHIVEIGAYHHHGPFNTRNPGVAQSSTATRAHSTRGVRSSCVHRPNTARTSVGNSHSELAALQGECLPYPGDANSFRHIRAVGGDRWQFGDRGGRPRFHAERYRSLSIDLMGHDRWASEALMIAERAAFYDSRHLLDRHRDMRLDIDNMSYEELLALGERIGSVNTGVPDDSLQKCLIETLCISSEPGEGERCSICLEEYVNMDRLATIKGCGHCYHDECIKKWLSIKNLCPICKVAALPDKEK